MYIKFLFWNGYITDWVDEYCDLTLNKFVETIQVKMKDIKLKDNII